ncbi:hypothetical protein GJV85_13100 [Sulfurimonas aquatica]|uniref:Uncharacterized protein n=1 Tax=Sulfurimonas aquatica TaxID=2672570 RepID=A0A975B2F1_9BACT|nr:hypothetical protein [Sulfurimonas aquatica]QSZ43001.1 hypothetical protein GJV85_13100 [Sulfurimonas aquatica]
MKKIRIILLVTLLLNITILNADTQLDLRKQNGYSYFTASTQCMNFSTDYTTVSGDNISTNASSNNQVYSTGSIFNLNNKFAFSTEVTTTLFPQRAYEQTSINGVLSQKNYADMMNNSLQGLGHYKFSDEHRVVFGSLYNISSWKRYKFIAPSGPESTSNVIEQRSMTLALQIGYWYEDYFLEDSKLHLSFRSLVGLPIWGTTENTSDDVVFSNRGGYNVDIVLNIGYPLYDNKEYGLMLGYSEINRDSAREGTIIVPKGNIQNTSIGLYVAF